MKWFAILLCVFITYPAYAGGKIYEPKDPKYGKKKPYTKRQLIIRGNKTFTLMYENNCPSSYKCVYNPWSKEPSIDDVVDSLNSIKKGNK